MDLNVNQLRKDLVIIYTDYLLNSDDEQLKIKAGELYNKYKDLDPFVKYELATAIRNLVDVAFNTGITLSGAGAKKILEDLKNCNP